jgi:hypothetical protein
MTLTATLRRFFLCAFILVAAQPGLADTPASQVKTQVVGPGQAYPQVPAQGEEWFDVGGFCKVVNVGDLSSIAPPVAGIPVFIPGSASQWENWRSSATTPSSRYSGKLTVTTCCRPQANIATLCASAANPTAVSRQYGRLGETDTVSATCNGAYGQYTESIPLTCTGDNGPDGQAAWQAGGDTDVCSPNARTTYGSCVAAGGCGTGSQTVQVLNSCGQVTQSYSQACDTGVSCCTPGPSSCGPCSNSCGRGSQTCSDGCSTWSQACSDSSGCCTPGAASCDACSSSTCGVDGTQSCSDGCSTWSQSCSPGPVPACDPGPNNCQWEYGTWSGYNPSACTAADGSTYGAWCSGADWWESCDFWWLSADQCSCDGEARPIGDSGATVLCGC